MKRSRQTIKAMGALVAFAGLLLSSPVPASAQSLAASAAGAAPSRIQVAEETDYRRKPGAGAMIIDGLLVRPVTFAATIIGGAVYLVTLPFSALGGNAGEAGEKLVVEPAAYTFTRCLGCFNAWP